MLFVPLQLTDEPAGLVVTVAAQPKPLVDDQLRYPPLPLITVMGPSPSPHLRSTVGRFPYEAVMVFASPSAAETTQVRFTLSVPPASQPLQPANDRPLAAVGACSLTETIGDAVVLTKLPLASVVPFMPPGVPESCVIMTLPRVPLCPVVRTVREVRERIVTGVVP